MMRKYLLLIPFVFGVAIILKGQSSHLPLNQDYYHLIERNFWLADEDSVMLFTSFKPYHRYEVFAAGKRSSPRFGVTDRFNADFLMLDNEGPELSATNSKSENPLLRKLYRRKPDFFHHRSDGFDFHLNPIIYFQLGKESETSENMYINTRGVSVRGSIDNKVFFYSDLTENQLRYPAYVRDYQVQNGVVPGIGFWKQTQETGYDFILARGHISVNATKHINLELGHDRFFIGNGYRSIMLSDFSNYMPYFKIKTKIWKVQYTNLYTQLTAQVNAASVGTLGTAEFPKKFATFHHLDVHLRKNLHIGIFESIVFSRQDSLGNNQFEFNYLNPIILFRAVEQHTGSPDNSILGFDGSWRPFKTVQLYGQFLIDEFIFSNIFGDKGNWTNKYAYQLGAKYFNALGIKNLDLQMEHNFARPYTYSHVSQYTNYAHYHQPLAHPLGASFSEMVGILRYQPISRMMMVAKALVIKFGENPDGQNYGADILVNYDNRTVDNLFVGSGIKSNLLYGDLRLSYHLKHNLFLDLKQVFRKKTSEEASLENNTMFTSVGIRLNFAPVDQAF